MADLVHAVQFAPLVRPGCLRTDADWPMSTAHKHTVADLCDKDRTEAGPRHTSHDVVCILDYITLDPPTIRVGMIAEITDQPVVVRSPLPRDFLGFLRRTALVSTSVIVVHGARCEVVGKRIAPKQSAYDVADFVVKSSRGPGEARINLRADLG